MKFLPGGVSTALAKRMLSVEKNSPELLLGAGIVGMIGSTVLACKATLKLEGILHIAAENIELAKEVALDPEHEDYSEQDGKNDTSLVYIKTSVKIGQLWVGPAIGLGVVSIAAIVKSHNILSKRNAALMAAYVAIEKGFAEYRQRVVDKYGEDEDRNLRYGSRELDVIVDGKKQKATRVGDDLPSIYSRFFDPSSSSWCDEPEYNFVFLHCQQNYANDLLRARGHVFLNEIYDLLGIPRSKAGAVVGWVRKGTESYINFGIFDDNDVVRDFVNGREGSIPTRLQCRWRDLEPDR